MPVGAFCEYRENRGYEDVRPLSGVYQKSSWLVLQLELICCIVNLIFGLLKSEYEVGTVVFAVT